ncbi:VWA domain-containing protein [Aliiroseovarius sp. F20344]|uniref:vWA domain-containing protein n=1 Tax=Aliiroseovarius sp. F20344 TaxID=2926414 RepID=UPI001FF2182F|nr:VWA domain-containing protein [Aliiroseovarius sp. F20344]MCK0142890.1 von Willebrand factor type A domain-containing protein [Aliiroseovarius sp. F20344]
MSDDLDDLKAALRAAPPAPEPSKKEADLALAMKNFDDFQGSRSDARPTSDAPRFGVIGKGVSKMLNALNTRGGLAATTAMVAVGFAVFVVMPNVDQVELPDVTVIPAQPVDDTLVDQEIIAAPAPTTLGKVAEQPARTRADTANELRAQAGQTAPAVVAEPLMEADASTFADTDGMIFEEEISIMPMAGEAGREEYANEAPSPLKITSEEPVSTFSIDVDTASYAVIRRDLKSGYMPNQDAVRIEEMVNYFPYAYPAPDGPHPFAPTVSTMQTPWNTGTQLVQIGIQGDVVDERPPLNLVFLIDTSGSMSDPDKLPLLKQSLRMMLSELRPEDEIAIVAYAGSAGEVLKPTKAAERATILAALDRLDAGGSTAGAQGIELAYQVAERMFDDGEVGRVLLATDGDFNVGIHDPDQLKDFIAKKRDTGTYLSILGFGRGNLDDATMQALAQNGNGQAAYIDTLGEARKVLVDQLSGALFPLADDVKIQVEFNPAHIAEYRLIGYETRALKREDFNNDKVDAGEIGAGHQVTAIYEVTPVGSDAVLTDTLRYAPEVITTDNEELGFLKLRYKRPGEDISTLIETPIIAGADNAGVEEQFAAAIAGFGQLLREDKYLGDWTYSDAISLANGAKGSDPYGYRAEAVTLMRLAESLSK